MVQPSRHPHARYRSGWVIPPAPVRPACHCLWFGRGSSTALRRSDILLCRRGPLRRTGDETPYLRSSRVPNRHSRSASKLAPRLCRCGPLPTLRNGVYRLAFGAMLPIVVALYGELDCQPTPLYRGDSVEAWVHGPHAFGGPSCCPQSRMHKPVPHGRSLWACRSLGALAQCEVEESSPTENGLRGLLVEGACLRGWAGRPGHSGRSWSSSSFATTENPVRVP